MFDAELRRILHTCKDINNLDGLEECCCQITKATGLIVERFVENSVVCIFASGTASKYWGSAMPITGSISGEGLKRGLIFRAQDTFNDPRANQPKAQLANAKSTMVIPIGSPAVAILKLVSDQENAFEGQDIYEMEVLKNPIENLIYKTFDLS